MSKKKPTRKKVIVSTNSTTTKNKLEPTASKVQSRSTTTAMKDEPMLFGRQNYYLLFLGIGLMALGMFLMSGGAQAANEWNADEIYSTRRTVIAPMVILAGLIVNIVAIFRKDTSEA